MRRRADQRSEPTETARTAASGMTSAALAPRLSQIPVTTARRPSVALPVTKVPRQSRDAPILAELLELHAVTRPRVIDCTYGKGVIWGRLVIRASVVKVDIQDLPGLDLVSDWRNLPDHYPRGGVRRAGVGSDPRRRCRQNEPVL
jgi:hypothetical protein